ncbi:thrombospondin type 3 repeat-containing protein [Patescibacteria group bacterium]|nr:thrombospondin type 3 repeat-containing protein [Patescibacteria group bacterium]
MKKLFIFLAVFAVLLGGTTGVFAKTDLSIADTDITLSKNNPFDGETIRIFARVFNIGDTDVYGYVSFLNNGKEITDPQPISVKANTYDDVFVDWKVKTGNSKIEAKIIGTNLTDDNPENNKIVKKEIFIDLDTDGDGIGNTEDLDDDNDGLSDEQEAAMKTDPLKPDTDGDKVKDNVDVFPLDPTESRDTDGDTIGDNKDPDDDNDSLTDEQELFQYGSNPLTQDSDNDGLSDGEEIYIGTNPNKQDTDGDGVIDSEDSAPLDASIGQAGLMGAIGNWFKDKPYLYAIFGAIAVVIIILLFRRKRD